MQYNYNLKPVDFVGQYMKGKTFKRQLEEAEKKGERDEIIFDLKMGAAREDALKKDTRQMIYMIESGQTDQIVPMLMNRAQQVESMGGDPKDTIQTIQMAQQANATGDWTPLLGQGKAMLARFAELDGTKGKYKLDNETGLVINENTGDVTVSETAQKRLQQLAAANAAGQKIDTKTLMGLNDEVTKFTKGAVDIVNSAKDLEALAANPTGPATIAAVFKFMKSLDPASVVREGEFYQAQASAGVPEMLTNLANKIFTGQLLTPEQFGDFIDSAKRLANTASKSASEQATGYLDVFGDRIPEGEKKLLINRLPVLFDIKELPLTPDDLAGMSNNSTDESDDDIAKKLQLPDIGG